MASSKKSLFSKPTLRFLSGDRPNLINPEPMFEFDEPDWNSTQTHQTIPSSDYKKSIRNSRNLKKWGGVDDADRVVGVAVSAPVNIPDWSKILKQDYKPKALDFAEAGADEEDEEEEEGERENRIPPHEFLARQFARSGVSSFSVHEGIGRTLKGRDLSRVRNAIWEKTGFQD